MFFSSLLVDGTEFRAVSFGTYRTEPAIYGDIVICTSGSSSTDIIGKNLATGANLTICSATYSQFQAAIYGDVVVWADNRNGTTYADIYAKHLPTGQEFCLSTGALNEQSPSIHGGIVVWLDNRVRMSPGYTIKSANLSARNINYGIFCSNSSPTIRQDRILACIDTGIYANGGSSPLVSANTIACSSKGIAGTLGMLERNLVQWNSVGLSACGGTIMDNNISENINEGLSSCSAVVSDNLILRNGKGVSGGSGSLVANTVSVNAGTGVLSYTGTASVNIVSGNGGNGVESCTGSIINNTIVGNKGSGVIGCTKIVKNNIIAWNGAYGISGACTNSYNDLWHNTSGPFSANWGKIGDIAVDPQFAVNGYWNGTTWVDGDYHLKSQYGRWDPSIAAWVPDSGTSRCVDSGDPADDIDQEPNPNGGRVNIGNYGGTAEASKSATTGPDPEPLCLSRPSTDVTGDCKVDFRDFAAMASEWLLCGYDNQTKCWE